MKGVHQSIIVHNEGHSEVQKTCVMDLKSAEGKDEADEVDARSNGEGQLKKF